MAKFITQTLSIDEVWFLFSHNIDKDPSIYAPLEHRMAMARLINKNYKDYPFLMSDAEYKTGTHLTADVLPKIKNKYPEHNFIWAMGADNLEHFHLWEGYKRIIEQTPIVILNRSNHKDKTCEAFKEYESYICEDPDKMIYQKNGIYFLDNPYIDLSSTDIREALKSGHGIFDNSLKDVLNYISEHNLYK